jgi:hypothetical protein
VQRPEKNVLGVVHGGTGGRCGEGSNGVGEGAGSGVGGDRTSERDVLGRGERYRLSPSPLPLSSSASHHRFTAFLVRFAGRGEGTGHDSGSEDVGSEGSGSWNGGFAGSSAEFCERSV